MRAVEHELDNRWGSLDVVMANAGIAGPTSYVEDVTLEDWKHCIAVNLMRLRPAGMQPAG